MEGLACPLYCALPGLEGSGIRVGRPDQPVAKIHQLLKIAVRLAIVMRTGSRLFARCLLIEIPQPKKEDIQRLIDRPALWVGEFGET